MAKNRVLVVEDDSSIAESIGLNLELSDYEYLILDDGLDVVEHLKSDHSFDLALLDIMLPGLDGFALMEVMQQYNIPALYLSAKDDEQSRVKGLRNGAEDYIVKPFSMLELLVRMEKILDRNGKLNKILRYRDITVDTEKHTVLQSGAPVSLQPLEFDLLVKLIKFKNCTLPRERLLNEIWGIDFVGGTRTVDIHIAHLRRKLGLNREIQSVTKVGYRLEDCR
ncbi:MAG: response regulator transcription factor [Eubacteriales bacterium]|nr:response regulator transcription factor [Eubacteriales bacterium]